MKRKTLSNLKTIEYLKRIKEDTTIEEHRMELDVAIKAFEHWNKFFSNVKEMEKMMELEDEMRA